MDKRIDLEALVDVFEKAACHETYRMVHGVRAVAEAVLAKAAPAWVSCAERLPTAEDADCRGKVWFCSSATAPCLVPQEGFGAGQVAPNVYWMPTGLVRPEPPKEELVPIWDNDFNDIQEGE